MCVCVCVCVCKCTHAYVLKCHLHIFNCLVKQNSLLNPSETAAKTEKFSVSNMPTFMQQIRMPSFITTRHTLELEQRQNPETNYSDTYSTTNECLQHQKCRTTYIISESVVYVNRQMLFNLDFSLQNFKGTQAQLEASNLAKFLDDHHHLCVSILSSLDVYQHFN